MGRHWLLRSALVSLAVAVVSLAAWAQSTRGVKGVRAKPPTFDKAATVGVFYDNVFEEGLVGERPAEIGKPPALARPASPSAGGGAAPRGRPGGGGLYDWSSVISAQTLEDQVKSIKLAADREITNPGKFRGSSYQWVRQEFSVLAMLFAIIAEYDGDVRWKEEAPVARDLIARTARNAKVGSLQVYNEAKLRRDQLGDLLNGSRLEGDAQRKANWEQVVDRAPLMQRLDETINRRLRVWTSNKDEFESNQEELLKEAEVVAAIAETLKQEGMMDAGDETYDGFAQQMKAAAREIVDAIKLNSYDQARESVGAIDQSCSSCHELYR